MNDYLTILYLCIKVYVCAHIHKHIPNMITNQSRLQNKGKALKI